MTGIFTAAKALVGKYPSAVRIGIALILVGLVWVIALTRFLGAIDRIEERGHEAGVNEAQVQAQNTALNNVGIAREAQQTIDHQADVGTGAELYAQCLRSARTPENCERFLPH